MAVNSVNYLVDTAPKNIDYLIQTYTTENQHFNLNDLKRKHKDYLFGIIESARRCVELQTLSVVYSGIQEFSAMANILRECLTYYDKIDTIKNDEELKTECENFAEIFNTRLEEFKRLEPNYELKYKTELRKDSLTLQQIKKSAQDILFSITGHHINCYIPYFELDNVYINYYSAILSELFEYDQRHYYSFAKQRQQELSSMFANGKFFNTSRDRINIQAESFDVVLGSFLSAMDGQRSKIYTMANYVRPGGKLILFGYATDLGVTDIRKIASLTKNIKVYFPDIVDSVVIEDRPWCYIIGDVKQKEEVSTEVESLLTRISHCISDDVPIRLNGTLNEDNIVFQSYDMTIKDYVNLQESIQKSITQTLVPLIPKTINDTRRPLLPFSSGQLGLVLISGDINGAIEEKENGCFHVVKGSSSQTIDRKTEVVQNPDDDNYRIRKETESVYSTTTVNIILPTGEIRTLK